MVKFIGFQNGINLGGWISQYDKYDLNHFDSFITEKDIAYIAELGYDHVRVPVDYEVLEEEDGSIKETGYQYLDKCLLWCQKYNLHMVIDLHATYGYTFDPLKGLDLKKFFYDEELINRFLKLWTVIARRYKDYPNEVAFEPLNEVALVDVKDAWNIIVRRYMETIRKICPHHFVIVGGVNYNHVLSIKYLDKPYDDHVVYNFHCYEPHIFTHQGAYWEEEIRLYHSDFRISYPRSLEEYQKAHKLVFPTRTSSLFKEGVTKIGPEYFEIIFKEALDKATEYDVNLYCGEYGVIDLADPESKKLWLNDVQEAFRKHHIGCAMWNYKEKDFGIVTRDFPNK